MVKLGGTRLELGQLWSNFGQIPGVLHMRRSISGAVGQGPGEFLEGRRGFARLGPIPVEFGRIRASLSLKIANFDPVPTSVGNIWPGVGRLRAGFCSKLANLGPKSANLGPKLA